MSNRNEITKIADTIAGEWAEDVYFKKVEPLECRVRDLESDICDLKYELDSLKRLVEEKVCMG
jgi:tetrahydromethanopterin S-methyltransferase subunit B